MSYHGKKASLLPKFEAETEIDRFPWHPRRVKAGSKKEETLIRMWNPYDEEYEGGPKPHPIRDRIDDAAWYQHLVHPELVVPYQYILMRRSYVLRVCEEQIQRLETVPRSKHYFCRPRTRRECEEVVAYAERHTGEIFTVSGFYKESLELDGIDALYYALEEVESYVDHVNDWESEYDHNSPRTWNEFWESRFDWNDEPSISYYEEDYVPKWAYSYDVDGTVADFEGRDSEAESLVNEEENVYDSTVEEAVVAFHRHLLRKHGSYKVAR